MPRKCCVPGCKSNYDSTSKENLQCVTTFSFPKSEEIRRRWLQVIPRKDWTPTPNSVVCCKHFNDEDIIRFDKFLQPDGSSTQLALRYPKLNEVAVPSIFPNLPAYLSTPAKPTRVDPETRRHNISKAHSERVSKFLKADDISDFNDLITNYSKQVSVFNWEVKLTDTHIHFFIIKFEQPLAIERSISIDKDLYIKMYLGKNELSYNDLKWVLSCDLRLRRWSELVNILSRYKFEPENSIKPSLTHLVEKGLQYIEKAYEICEEEDDFAYRKQLAIIKDQLKIIVSKKHRYSTATIIMAFMLYCQSSSCYNLLRDFFVLPHKRYLQLISSSLHVSPGTDDNNKNYLVNRSKSLSDNEKVVSLLIDEIYITGRLDYRAKSIIGLATNDNEVAKTILSFMISSAFGSFKEIVKLLPVHNIKGEDMTVLTTKIITFIQDCGFVVICVITDNHSINRTMFKTFSPSAYSFINPNYADNLIFLVYDFVHIFKNIWKNWLNLKNIDQTFAYLEFEGDELKYAKFKHIKDVYQTEKNCLIKQAYKLNYKSLYPSVLERQKVHLADNIFHHSTIATLKNNANYKDTAEFLEIIRKWWDIVNNTSIIKGNIKKNDWCKPFRSSGDSRLVFLKQFVVWLDKWHSIDNNNGHLTQDTYKALRQSTLVLIDLIDYCFKKYSPKYILAGKFTTENLEKRFGMYRSLCGCNYNVSLDDVLGAEKKIRIKRIFKNTSEKFSLADIQSEFNVDCPDIPDICDSDESLVGQLLFILGTNYLEVAEIDPSAKIYVSGYVAHAVSKKLNCNICISLITAETGEYANNEYFDYLQRSGLSISTDSVNFIFVHMFSILSYIINNRNQESTFLKSANQKTVLCKLTVL